MSNTIASNFALMYKEMSETPLTDKNLTVAQAAKCVNSSSLWIVRGIYRIVVWSKGKGWINTKKILLILDQTKNTLGTNPQKIKQSAIQITEIMAGAHYITPKPALLPEEFAVLQKISKLAEIFIKLSKPELPAPSSQLFKDLQEFGRSSMTILTLLQVETPPPAPKPKQPSGTSPTPPSQDPLPTPPVKPKGNPLIEKFSDESKEVLTKFITTLSQVQADPKTISAEEYAAIVKLSQDELTIAKGYCSDRFKLDPFKDKNRYPQVLPWECNCYGNENGEGYINASRVKLGDMEFISAQGPKSLQIKPKNPGTIGDFFNLARKSKVKVIVCLVSHLEYYASLNANIEKCAPYWKGPFPIKLDEGYEVVLEGEKCISENEEDQIVWERTFVIKKDGEEPQKVMQLHYENFPDFGVPDPELFETLIQNVMTYDDASSPILTHCSAGLGRTGTFIAAYSLIKEIEAKLKAGIDKETIRLNLVERVIDMRTQRGGLVQNQDQYQAIKDTIVKWFTPAEEIRV
ncbi:MAG: hypothetical protein CK425_11815 [Parachlamydia sp.]|nr:MAG: hypothetical protein CK425_11815 [Parachlamydia sp.]